MVLYATVITVIVAVSLSFLSESLKEKQYHNELQAKKIEILRSVGLDTVADPGLFFDRNIHGLVLNKEGEVLEGKPAIEVDVKAENKKPAGQDRLLPIFIYTRQDSGKIYIIPLYGAGLWDDIWGYIALEDDFNTVYGTSFGHKGETPGLGGEITTDWFQKSFKGKTIFEGDEFVSVIVKKGKLDNPKHQVHSITGATMTSNGVTNMIRDDLANYLAYFEKVKNGEL